MSVETFTGDRPNFEDNPELYGLRRSSRMPTTGSRVQYNEGEILRRSMYAESSEESDSEVYGARKRRSRASSRKPAEEEVHYDSAGDDDDDDDGDDVYGSSKRARQQDRALSKKRRRLHKEEDAGAFAAEVRFSTRNSKVVNYALDDDSDQFEEEMRDDESGWETYQSEPQPELGKSELDPTNIQSPMN